jgi:hypothetical protein
MTSIENMRFSVTSKGKRYFDDFTRAPAEVQTFIRR